MNLLVAMHLQRDIAREREEQKEREIERESVCERNEAERESVAGEW